MDNSTVKVGCSSNYAGVFLTQICVHRHHLGTLKVVISFASLKRWLRRTFRPIVVWEFSDVVARYIFVTYLSPLVCEHMFA
jgi:hypothetical protein